MPVEDRPEPRGTLHPPTIWFTGPPASGKSTLGALLAERLRAVGLPCQLLDGDALRRNLWPELGYSDQDRVSSLLRICRLCRMLGEQGIFCVVGAISPFEKTRARIRESLDAYLEVYCRAGLKARMTRDPHGLYRRAAAGEITGLTGYDAPYQEPVNRDLELDTEALSPEQSVEAVLGLLRERDYLPPAG